MNTEHVTAFLRSLSAASRRGLLAGVASGLFAAGPLALGDAAAKPNGKNKRKRKNKRSKKRKQQNQNPSPPPPGPITRADVTCAGPRTEGVGGNTGDALAAQTFVALSSGPLASAQLEIVKEEGTDGDLVLRLAPVVNDLPTEDVLAETSIANADLPDEASAVLFAFPNPFPVVAGTRYALVLTRPGGGRFRWFGHFGDTCVGAGFLSQQPATPFRPISDEDDFFDFNFTTFVSA